MSVSREEEVSVQRNQRAQRKQGADYASRDRYPKRLLVLVCIVIAAVFLIGVTF